MIGTITKDPIRLLRDLCGYPCFECDHSSPHFCIFRGRRCDKYDICYRGVYPNYSAADAAIPAHKPKGFDSSAVTDFFLDHLSDFNPGDYPVVLRLVQVLRPGVTVFDLGGGFGQCYYAYRKLIEFPSALSWKVCDVRAFAELGEEIATERAAPSLSFTQDWQQASGSYVYLTNGALQYIEPSLSEMLRQLAVKPAHVLINRVPTCECDEFYTVQHAARTYSPYKVMNTARFVEEMKKIDYKPVDQWDLPRTLHVPLHPECQTPVYRGFYFVHSESDTRP